MRTLIRKIPYYLAALISFCCAALVIGLLLMDNGPEFSMQHILFFRGAIACGIAAIFTCLFGQVKEGWGIRDVLVLVFIAYIIVNYNLVSKVDASSKIYVLVYSLIWYLSVKVFYHKFPYFRYFCLMALLVCGIIQAFGGLGQVLGHSPSRHSMYPVTGTFFNPGPYGGFLALTMSLSLLVIVRLRRDFIPPEEDWKERTVALFKNPVSLIYIPSCICLTVGFMIFFAVMSRAAIVSFFVTAAIIFLTDKDVRNRLKDMAVRNKKVYAASICAVIVLLIFSGVFLYRHKKDSADGRSLMFKVSADMIISGPILGTGYGFYNGEYRQAQARYLETGTRQEINVAGSPEFAFNEYFRIWAETGLPGFALLLSIVGGSVYRGIRYGGVMWPGLASLALFAFFSYPLGLLCFVMVVPLLVAEPFDTGKQPKPSTLPERLSGIAVFALLSLAGVYLLPSAKDKLEAYKEWKNISYLYNAGYAETLTGDYAQVYPYMRDNPAFLFEYGRALCLAGDHRKSNRILAEGSAISADPMFLNVMGNNYKALGMYDESEKYYNEALRTLPNRIYPLYLLMHLYIEKGDDQCVRETCNRIMAFEPKVESTASREIKTEAEKYLLDYSENKVNFSN